MNAESWVFPRPLTTTCSEPIIAPVMAVPRSLLQHHAWKSAKDTDVYNTDMVTVIEIMGRHAGWLTASAALYDRIRKRLRSGSCYLPERDFDLDQFTEDVTKIMKQKKMCLLPFRKVCIMLTDRLCPRQKTSGTDGFGHAQLGGLAVKLANYPKKERMGLKRFAELSLVFFSAVRRIASAAVDIDEAYSVRKVCRGSCDKRRYRTNGST